MNKDRWINNYNIRFFYTRCVEKRGKKEIISPTFSRTDFVKDIDFQHRKRHYCLCNPWPTKNNEKLIEDKNHIMNNI